MKWKKDAVDLKTRSLRLSPNILINWCLEQEGDLHLI